MIAKIAGIAVLVWFYLTAEKLNQPSIKWAIIGEIGYWLAWILTDKAIDSVLPATMSKTAMGFILLQIPVLGALAAVYFIRSKLIHDADNNSATPAE